MEFFQILSLLINMKAPHLHPPPFHPEILRDACLGFIQLAAHCLQLRFDPGFLEACNTKIKVSPPPKTGLQIKSNPLVVGASNVPL